MESKRNSFVNVMFRWIENQYRIVKILIGVIFVVSMVVAIMFFFTDDYHIILYILSQAAHIGGLMTLIYKLIKKKTCSGLSLKSQEVTAIVLAVRICCSFIYYSVHIVFDLAELAPTIWVIYMIRYKLNSTYNKDLDNLALKKLVIPACILALVVHPNYNDLIEANFWAFCIYLEAVSVMPQLRLIQNAKMVEPLTAHYIFALGVANFLGCIFSIIMHIDHNGNDQYDVRNGIIWALVHFISTMIQAFITVDFCYYYVKSIIVGQLSVLSLPV